MSITIKQLKSLKEELERGESRATISFLENESEENDLSVFREQKLLLKLRNPPEQAILAKAYKNAAKRLSSTKLDIESAERYADFTSILVSRFELLTQQMRELCLLFQHLPQSDFLELMQEVVEQRFYQTADLHWEKLKCKPNEEQPSPVESGDLTGYVLQELNGELNDIAFATTRALNAAVPFTDPKTKKRLGRDLRSKTKQSLLTLIQMAGYWNTLIYAADLVSYGECTIKSIRQIDSIEVELMFSDLAQAKAKAVGLRREITANFFGRQEPRWMAESLQAFAASTIDRAIEYYESQWRPGCFSRQELKVFQSNIFKWLDRLDAEDELLVPAAKDNLLVLGTYLAAVALHCFAAAGDFVHHHIVRGGKRESICPQVPIDMIVNLIMGVSVTGINQMNRDLVRTVVESMILSLPATNHFELLDKPYIKLSSGKIVSLTSLRNGNWAPAVRRMLVKGGPLAKTYGSIWEEFVCYTMKNYGWSIVGRGIKIRRGNQIATDVDILAWKDQLLLLIQLKAIVAGGINLYEQWKARNTIIEGTVQATVAEREIKQNATFLSSLLSSKGIAQAPNRIQPMVLTTVPIFTGWSHNGVPVISIGYLMSLLRGAQVRYQTPDHKVVAVKQFARGDELSSEEFIQFLYEPWDWQISSITEKVQFRRVELESLTLNFPNLLRDPPITD